MSLSLIHASHFLGGFALLPFLWFINVVWFFREAFIKPSFTGQSKIKSCMYDHGFFCSTLTFETIYLQSLEDFSWDLGHWVFNQTFIFCQECFRPAKYRSCIISFDQLTGAKKISIHVSVLPVLKAKEILKDCSWGAKRKMFLLNMAKWFGDIVAFSSKFEVMKLRKNQSVADLQRTGAGMFDY